MNLSTLQKRPTIRQSQCDDLKLETRTRRVWLSRMTIEDGMPYNNQVTEEVYNVHTGRWETLKQYEAKEGAHVYRVYDTRFLELPPVKIRATSSARAKIIYCQKKGINPLLNADKLLTVI